MTNVTPLMQSLRSLYDDGFNLIWLYPESKIPVEKGWNKQARKGLDELTQEYQNGYNLSFRPGAHSIGTDGKAIIVLDMDVEEDKYLPEALAASLLLMNGEPPSAISGSQIGRHWDIRVPPELCNFGAAVTIQESSERVKRVREDGSIGEVPAWKIELLGTGKHCVLPPSIHPETRLEYQWVQGKPVIYDAPPKIMGFLEGFKTPPPVPLLRPLVAQSKYPIGSLGPVLGEAAKALARRVQIPDSLAGQAILGAATVAVQAHVKVAIDGREYPISEFFLSIAESGDRKSAADKVALKEHYSYQRDLELQHETARRRYEQDKALYDSDCAVIKRDTKKFPTTQDRRNALAQLAVPVEPPKPQFLSDDPTYEGLVKSLAKGQLSQGVFSSEGGLFLGGYAMNQDNMLKTVAGLCKLWDGDPINRTRAEAGELFTVFERRVSLHLMVQPNIAELLLGNQQLHGQGFLSRFLVTYPSSMAGHRLYAAPLPEDDAALAAYYLQTSCLLRSPPTKRVGPNGQVMEELASRMLPLTDTAKANYVKFYNASEKAQAPQGRLSEIKPFASKSAAHVLRIAAVLAMFDDPNTAAIDGVHIQRAGSLVKFYLAELLRLSNLSSPDPSLLLAKQVLDWLHRSGWDVFSLQKLYQNGPAAVRDKRAAEKIVAILIDYGWLHVQQTSGGKSKSYKVVCPVQ